MLFGPVFTRVPRDSLHKRNRQYYGPPDKGKMVNFTYDLTYRRDG